jgi:hypothetical protein
VADNSEILEKIEELITAVYRDRTVNPWNNGPKRSIRFEYLFRERLPDWPLLNQTDKVHGGSTVLAFLLHPGHYIGVPTRDGVEVRLKRLGGECYQALLEISHIGPFARIRFTRETLDDESNGIAYEEHSAPYREDDDVFLADLINKLDLEGIIILTDEILHRPVSDIELDVTDVGCANIYHCLFDEE